MSDSLGDRIKHAWNAFTNGESRDNYGLDFGFTSMPGRQDRYFGPRISDKSVVASIFNQISVDAASYTLNHVRIDKNNRFLGEIDSGLSECLEISANLDQTGRAFLQDCYQTLCEEGVIAIVPVDTDLDPKNSNTYEIRSLRVGRIIGWQPDKVRVSLYNEKKGRREEVVVAKRYAAIVENPHYTVMNEPNSLLKRLIDKIALLDMVDKQSSSGKLDIIIQLPYVIKSEERRAQAEKRRKDIEFQLQGSQYGIAYTDGTEKITQLNRPAENNLAKQVEYLTDQLYRQFGLTEEVFKGTADEKTMINYYNRTIEPMLSAVAGAMTKTFLTKTARTQGQRVMYYRDPFRLVEVSNLAEIADKFTRNQVLTPNEVRGLIGFRPSDSPVADELQNPNLYPTAPATETIVEEPVLTTEQEK